MAERTSSIEEFEKNELTKIGERAMNNIAQEKKSMLLEQAVINSSVEELSKIYDELGYVESSARALGVACRFRGLEMVKILVEKGASFDVLSIEERKEKYHHDIGRRKYSNYSLYLLKVFRGELKGACCLRGMALNKSAKKEVGKPLAFLADDERIKVLNYLFENREKVFFQPEELLFYAIYAKDTVIVEELRILGVRLSEMRVHIITEGGKDMNEYWQEYSAMTRKLTGEDYIEIMQQLALELDGKLFYFTEKVFGITKKHFHDVKVFEFVITHFKQDKMNKSAIIRDLIDRNALDALLVVEREGWLNIPRRRDKIIEYASEKNKTEILAWLLDFKNRTIDYNDEQEMAEKMLIRELNASPNSIVTLKKIWSYRKREDGTLIITNYRGKSVNVVVPEKIGKNIVIAIGNGAFAGNAGCCGSKVTVKQAEQHNMITKIVLPKTLQYIGRGAFCGMSALEEINISEGVKEIDQSAFSGCSSLKSIIIPNGVKEIKRDTFRGCSSLKNVIIPDELKKIGEDAFYKCSSLKNITIPGTVDKIKHSTFAYCENLEKVCICEGVTQIDELAFSCCSNLTEIKIPKSVQRLMTDVSGCHKWHEVFSNCPKLTVYCPKGSKTETYCMKKGIRFQYSDDFS